MNYDNDDLPCIQAGPIHVPVGHPEYVAVVESDAEIAADMLAIHQIGTNILEGVHAGVPPLMCPTDWPKRLRTLMDNLNKGMVLYELALMLPNWPDDE